MKKNDLLLLVLVSFLSLPSVLALFHPGFFLTDDGNWMIIRFSAFYDAMRHGEFPVRFLPRLNHELGYPVADFLYPGFMYLGVAFHIIGAGFVNSVKIILGLSLLGSGIFSFLWLRKKFGILPSIVGALFYTYFPYHLWDVYTRGSVGEVLALCVVPFILWQSEENNYAVTILGTAFLILSHNTLALLFLPCIVGYMLFVQKLSFIVVGSIILWSLAISAFFWMPALYDKKFTIFDSVKVATSNNYFVNDENLIGISFVVVFFLSIWQLYRKADKTLYLFLLCCLASLFLSYKASGFLWHTGLLTTYVQFPFRFLSLVSITGSYMTAAVLANLEKRFQIALSVLVIFLVYYASLNYLYPKVYQNYPDSFYATNEDTTTVQNEYMPKWTKVVTTYTVKAPLEIVSGQGIISSVIRSGASINAQVILQTQSTLQINTLFFPGWEVFLDGRKVAIDDKNPLGVMRFSAGSGNHTVRSVFSETPLRLFSDVISLLCLIMILCYGRIIRQVKRGYNKNKTVKK